MSFVCLLQFAVAIALESQYDKNIKKSVWSVIWYPLIYWYVNVFITLAALIKVILPKKKLATWKSPDRGITQSNAPKQETIQIQNKPKQINTKYSDIKVSRLVQAYSSDPENASLHSDLIDGSVENPIIKQDTSHIENKVKQKKWKKIIEIILTVIAWIYLVVYWVFMIYGIFCDLTHRPIKEWWIYNKATIHQTEHFFVVLFIAILIETLVLILWKEYNLHRFGRLRRRKFKGDVTEAELDEYFKLDPKISDTLHHGKYIELYENPIPEEMGRGRQK